MSVSKTGCSLTALFSDAKPDARRGAEDVARILAGLNRGQGSPRRPQRAKENGSQATGRTRGGWNTKIHVVAASDTVITGVWRELAGR